MTTKYYPTLRVVQTSDWFGVPFQKRYSSSVRPDRNLLKAIKDFDDKLDLKFYLPTEQWHLVRYIGSIGDKFTHVWTLEDNPELGLRKEPGMWIIDGLKQGDMHGAAANRVDEIDKHNSETQQSTQREVHEQCKDLSKDMLTPLVNLEAYGENSDTHLNYQVPKDFGDKQCT